MRAVIDALIGDEPTNQITLTEEHIAIAETENNGGIQPWIDMGTGFRNLIIPGWPPTLTAMLTTGETPSGDVSQVLLQIAGDFAVRKPIFPCPRSPAIFSRG